MPDSSDWRTGLSHSGPWLGLGMQLAGTMVFYVLAGYGVDYFFQTSPWGLLGGAVLGMVAFFVQLMRVVREMDRENKARKKERAE